LKMLKQERMECLLIYVLRTKLININQTEKEKVLTWKK
jgi:hypothetical protein